ncbi:TOG domain-containing protein, partial [Caerostris extrusa]
MKRILLYSFRYALICSGPPFVESEFFVTNFLPNIHIWFYFINVARYKALISKTVLWDTADGLALISCFLSVLCYWIVCDIVLEFTMAGSLQQFIPLLATQDIKKRIQLGSDILSCLRTPSGLLDCDEIGFFIDSVASWLSNSNFKVAQNGIEIMTILAEEMKEEFKPYISTIFPATVDRLGDSKDQVCLQAKSLMIKLMNCFFTS